MTDNITLPVVMADIRLAKQRRAHAVLMPGKQDYRYYTDFVEAVAFIDDGKSGWFHIETDFGTATVWLSRLVPNRHRG